MRQSPLIEVDVLFGEHACLEHVHGAHGDGYGPTRCCDPAPSPRVPGCQRLLDHDSASHGVVSPPLGYVNVGEAGVSPATEAEAPMKLTNCGEALDAHSVQLDDRRRG